MLDLVTIVPFALMGVAMVVFGLVLNRQSTLSAQRIDAMRPENPRVVQASMSGGATVVAEVSAQVSAAELKEVSTY